MAMDDKFKIDVDEFKKEATIEKLNNSLKEQLNYLDNYAGYFLFCAKCYMEQFKKKPDYITDDFLTHKKHEWLIVGCSHTTYDLNEKILEYIEYRDKIIKETEEFQQKKKTVATYKINYKQFKKDTKQLQQQLETLQQFLKSYKENNSFLEFEAVYSYICSNHVFSKQDINNIAGVIESLEELVYVAIYKTRQAIKKHKDKIKKEELELQKLY